MKQRDYLAEISKEKLGILLKEIKNHHHQLKSTGDTKIYISVYIISFSQINNLISIYPKRAKTAHSLLLYSIASRERAELISIHLIPIDGDSHKDTALQLFTSYCLTLSSTILVFGSLQIPTYYIVV